MSARSASSAATRTVRAPWAAADRASTRSTASATPPGSPSTSTSSTAAASVGKPACTKSSTARVMRGVHHLDRGGHDAGGDDGAHGGGAVVDRRRSRAAACAPPAGSGVRRTAIRVAMPSVPSPPTNAPRRSSPAGSGSRPPSSATVAVGQHHLDGQDVGAGDAVGEAVRAAGVGGDVAADRAATAGSTGRARSGGRSGATALRQVEVEDARLDPRHARRRRRPSRTWFIFVVTITTGPSRGTAPPARPVPEPAGDERPAVAARRPARRPAPRRSTSGSRRPRPRPLDVGGVAPVQRELERLGPDTVGRQRGAEIGEERATQLAVAPLPAGASQCRHARDGSAVVWRAMAPTGPRRPPRVDLVRGSRRGPHVGVRRHVPAVGTGRASSATAARACSPARRPSWCRGAAATAPTSSTTRTSPPSRRPPTASPTSSGSSGARASGAASLHTEEDGTRITRLVDGACIFLNRPGFAAGAGLRAAPGGAGDAGERPMDWKPDVCWQLPLRLAGAHRRPRPRHVSTLREWKRRDWGEGGFEFHWWCTESPDAFVGDEPVYVHDARRDRRDGRRAGLRHARGPAADASGGAKHGAPPPRRPAVTPASASCSCTARRRSCSGEQALADAHGAAA